MTRVKICGIRTPEDARAAADAGASAIGMVFWPGSPRAVDAAAAREIVAALPTSVPAIGVFVNQSVEQINEIARHAGLFGVQLHGDEPLEMIPLITRPVIRALTLARAAAIDTIDRRVTILLDAHDPARRGGTGQAIDWREARRIAEQRDVMLAGGLSPDNVEEAIETVRPYAVDVSSGVEKEPGVKDHARMRAFVEAVRRADQRIEVAR